MDDIVIRLRDCPRCCDGADGAAEIEQLRAENERLRVRISIMQHAIETMRDTLEAIAKLDVLSDNLGDNGTEESDGQVRDV